MISKPSAFFFGIAILLFSCKEKLDDKVALGGKKYGGVFTYFTPEKTDVFFPLYSPTVYNQRILSQIFEPLFILDEKGKIVHNLAKSIKTSQDGKTITVGLRNDVYFHSDESVGALKMLAEDVKFSLSFACSANKWNSFGSLLRDKIVGGQAYYKNSSNHVPESGVKGIKVINDSTLQLSLTDNYPNFQKLLTHPSLIVFSKTVFSKYKDDIIYHPIGTGPFLLKSSEKSRIILERNNSYWKKDRYGNQLPFLAEVRILNSSGIRSEYMSFSKKEADILFQLPVDELDHTFGSLADAQKGKNLLHRVVVKKGTKINYLSFDCSSYPFNNELVRRAFLLAIDRKRICYDAMNGEGNYAINGFVPNNDYYKPNITEILLFNPTIAKKLMTEAGYDENNHFPKLTFYINAQKGGITDKWSREIVRQLKENIGIELDVKYCSLDQKHKAILSGKAKIWKSAWVPDYPDAEAYFRVFYGNKTGFSSEESNYNNFNDKVFDSIYLQIERTRDLLKRNKLQNALDKVLVEKAAMVPIFSEDIFVIVNLRVRDFQINNSGIIDFSKIYIKEVF
ncbi:MAG: ABC transporter substrate-binding protein [Bacteroidetes bacterium]|nr:ABC transporter substrate-binding protein [Bacteroidota bacterium]